MKGLEEGSGLFESHFDSRPLEAMGDPLMIVGARQVLRSRSLFSCGCGACGKVVELTGGEQVLHRTWINHGDVGQEVYAWELLGVARNACNGLTPTVALQLAAVVYGANIFSVKTWKLHDGASLLKIYVTIYGWIYENYSSNPRFCCCPDENSARGLDSHVFVAVQWREKPLWAIKNATLETTNPGTVKVKHCSS
eukprot:Gb_19957 [translate_table: standard]